MQRYHLPILSLAIVSTIVLYLVYTQRPPIIFDADMQSTQLDINSIVYFLVSLSMALIGWVSIITYFILRLSQPHQQKRQQTRQAIKSGTLIAFGVTFTALLQIINTLNIVTGILLWATVLAAMWKNSTEEQKLQN